MPAVCLQILFGIGCAALVNVAILGSSYVYAPISSVEVKRHATAPAADKSFALDVPHCCSCCSTCLLLGNCALELDQVSVLKTLQTCNSSQPCFSSGNQMSCSVLNMYACPVLTAYLMLSTALAKSPALTSLCYHASLLWPTWCGYYS